METFKRWVKNSLIVLGVLFILLFAYVIFDDTEDSKDTVTYTPVTTLPANNDSIGDFFEEEFIDGCTSEGASRSFCRCAFEYLDENYTNREIMDMAEDVALYDATPDGMMAAATECLEYY